MGVLGSTILHRSTFMSTPSPGMRAGVSHREELRVSNEIRGLFSGVELVRFGGLSEK